MGDSYYEPKFLGNGPVSTPSKKAIVKRLTPADCKTGMYEYKSYTIDKNGQGFVTYKVELVLLVQLTNTKDDKVYQFGDNKFVPNFDRRVNNIVADKPVLSEKIKNKGKDYFYPLPEQAHQGKVWWNIVNEYNQP